MADNSAEDSERSKKEKDRGRDGKATSNNRQGNRVYSLSAAEDRKSKSERVLLQRLSNQMTYIMFCWTISSVCHVVPRRPSRFRD